MLGANRYLLAGRTPVERFEREELLESQFLRLMMSSRLGTAKSSEVEGACCLEAGVLIVVGRLEDVMVRTVPEGRSAGAAFVTVSVARRGGAVWA